MSNYVGNLKEISGVSKVRKEYIKKYTRLLIQWGLLNKDSIIVDVPCGTGEMMKALSTNNIGRKYYLIDVNPIMIKAARKQMIRNSICTIGDAGNIGKLVPEKVDAIFCLNGFHIYINRKQEFLYGCNRILKPKGVLIFDLSTKGFHDKASRAFLEMEAKEMEISAKKNGSIYRPPVSVDDSIMHKYRNMAIKAGFLMNKTLMFNTWMSINTLINQTVTIPGRLRPRLPGISDRIRIKIFKRANQIAKKRTGIKIIEHTRIFFLLKKEV